MQDLHGSIKYVKAIAPVVVTDNTAQVSSIIDLQGMRGCEFVITTGTLADADATFAVTLDEGDDSSLTDAAAVAAGDLLGSYAGASFTFADDNTTKKLGYAGTKRYVRLTITPSANTGNAPLSAVAALWAMKAPQS